MHWLQKISPVINTVWQGSYTRGVVTAPIRIYDHKLICVTGGRMRVHHGGGDAEYGPGTFLIIPPAYLHSIYAISDEPLDRVVIHFDWTASESRTGPPWSVPEQVTFVPDKVHAPPDFIPGGVLDGIRHDARTDMLLDWIVTDWREHGQGIREPRGLLLTLLTTMLAPDEKRNVETQQQQHAFQVRKLMNDTASVDMPMSERLAQLPYSHEHTTRPFQKHFGISPTRHMTLTRIEMARQHLRTTELPIADIASRCGFQSAAYFSRVFRANTGTGPARCRRQHHR